MTEPKSIHISDWTKSKGFPWKVDNDTKRFCSVCGKEMTEGYCFADGLSYYCSDECLHKDFTDEEWQRIYDAGNGYWTQWEE